MALSVTSVGSTEFMITSSDGRLTWAEYICPFTSAVLSSGVQFNASINACSACNPHNNEAYAWNTRLSSMSKRPSSLRVTILNDVDDATLYIGSSSSSYSLTADYVTYTSLSAPSFFNQAIGSHTAILAPCALAFTTTQINVSTFDIDVHFTRAPIVTAVAVSSAYNLNPTTKVLDWSFIPDDADNLKYRIGAGAFTDVTGGFSGTVLNGYDSIRLAYYGANKDKGYTIIVGSDYNQTRVTNAVFYPRVYAYSETTSATNVLMLTAMSLGSPILSSKSVAWTMDDADCRGYYGATYTQPYTFGTAGVAYSSLKLSATDYSKTYTYGVSSDMGIVYNVFRPYYPLTPDTTAFIYSEFIPQQPGEEFYSFKFKVLGNTAGSLVHNIEPGQYVMWSQNSSANISSLRSDLVTPYSMNTTSIAANVDEIYVRIYPDVVLNNPATRTASFSVYLLPDSTGNTATAERTATIEVSYSDILSNEVFSPKIKFQYEKEQTTNIYRPLNWLSTGHVSAVDLPANTFGYVEFGFDDGIDTVNYDLRYDSNDSIFTNHAFNTSTARVCSINMTVYASGAGYEGYAKKLSYPTNIVFSPIPVISQTKIYPEYQWNKIGSVWDWRMNADKTGALHTATIPNSCYGLCHTENMLVSAAVGSANISRSNWVLTNGDSYTHLTSAGRFAFGPFKTGKDTAMINLCAALFTDALSSDMPSVYFDTPTATRFSNYFDTATQLGGLTSIGVQDFGTTPYIDAINTNVLPAPGTLSISGSYTPLANATLFDMNINSFFITLSSAFWTEDAAADVVNGKARVNAKFKGADGAFGFLGVPKGEVTDVRVIPAIDYRVSINKNHPKYNDWCLTDLSFSNEDDAEMVKVYPMEPIVYTLDRFTQLGQDSILHIQTPACSALDTTFTWRDRGVSALNVNDEPYIATYDKTGEYGIQLTTSFNFNKPYRLTTNYKSIVNAIDNYYDYTDDSLRIFGITETKAPYDRVQSSIPPNETLTSDNFNAVLGKFKQNLAYIKQQSFMYDTPPTAFIGWYGTVLFNNNIPRTRWFANLGNNSYKWNRPDQGIDTEFSDLQHCYVDEDNDTMILSEGQKVTIRSKDLHGAVLAEITEKTLNDNFSNIRSVRMDSLGRIYLLDSFNSKKNYLGSKNRIVVYDYDPESKTTQIVYDWGGLGGPTAKTKFFLPNDMYIDAEDHIWVSDSGNKCIKKFTRTGSWLQTIQADIFNTSAPLSLCVRGEELVVLTADSLLRMNQDGSIIAQYLIEPGAIRVEECSDKGMYYIVYANKISKYTFSGVNVGSIAEAGLVNYSRDFRSVFHDKHRNLFIMNSNHILHYVDIMSSITILEDRTSYEWSDENIQVGKNEFIQDWVINKCIGRLWDNIEITRRSLIGRFTYQTIGSTTTVQTVSTFTPPADFDYCTNDWIHNTAKVTEEDVTYEYTKPIVRAFKPSELEQLPYTKEEIFIGLNENTSAAVFNRIFGKLYDCLEVLLQMVS